METINTVEFFCTYIISTLFSVVNWNKKSKYNANNLSPVMILNCKRC